MDAGTPSVPQEPAGGANEQTDQARWLAAVYCAGEMTQSRTLNGGSWNRPEVNPSCPDRVFKIHSEEKVPSRLLPIQLGQFHHISAQT